MSTLSRDASSACAVESPVKVVEPSVDDWVADGDDEEEWTEFASAPSPAPQPNLDSNFVHRTTVSSADKEGGIRVDTCRVPCAQGPSSVPSSIPHLKASPNALPIQASECRSTSLVPSPPEAPPLAAEVRYSETVEYQPRLASEPTPSRFPLVHSYRITHAKHPSSAATASALESHSAPMPVSSIGAASVQESQCPGAPPLSTCLSPAETCVSPSPVRGFDTLDEVQRYAVGALATVLLSRHVRTGDLNGAAFARSLTSSLFVGLGLRPGQQTALLALEPDETTVYAVVQQCVDLVGSESARFEAVQAMMALAVAGGLYDARSRAFLMAASFAFDVDWPKVAAVELAVAIQLLEEPIGSIDIETTERTNVQLVGTDMTRLDMANMESKDSARENTVSKDTLESSEKGGLGSPEDAQRSGTSSGLAHSPRRTASAALAARRKRKLQARRAMKVSGITVVGGLLFGVTGGLIAPALLSALAGVGVASAAGLAASGTAASGAVVGGLFGVAGAGLSGRKANHRMALSLNEFDFEHRDDPRVIEARKRRTERALEKQRKAAMKEKPALVEAGDCGSGALTIDGPSPPKSQCGTLAAELNSVAVSQGVHFADGDRDSIDDDLPDDRDANDNSTIPKRATRDALPQPMHGVSGEASSSLTSDDEDNENLSRKEKKKKRKSRRRGTSSSKRESRGLDTMQKAPGLHLCISVPGWLHGRSYGTALEQFENALEVELPCSQHLALRWESARLYEMSLAFAKFWASKATVTTIQQAYPHAIAAASSVAGAVAFAFALPLTVISCMDYIDNPWSVLVSRSNSAGEQLAEALIERAYGQRPVTLVGYSLGARVVFKCLEALMERNALGIVYDVFLLGAPVSAEPDRWKTILPVVSGRIVNGYLGIDWALAFFHRGCGHGVYVAGLRPIDVEGVVNMDLSLFGIEGHGELKDCMPRALQAMGMGTGYIVLPPAPLVVKKKSKSSSRDKETEKIVDFSEDKQSGFAALRFATSSSKTSVTPGYVDTSPASMLAVENGNELSSKANFELGASLAAQQGLPAQITDEDLMWGSELERMDQARDMPKHSMQECHGSPGKSPSLEAGKSHPYVESDVMSSEEKGKKKKKSWMSLGAIGTKLTGLTGVEKGGSSHSKVAVSKPSPESVPDEDSWEAPPVSDGIESTKPAFIRTESPRTDVRKRQEWEPEHTHNSNDGEEALYVGEDDVPNVAGFDWELQRKIWEEQERQLLENGITNAPVCVEEKPTVVVLGLGIEVTGRRLRSLIPQDTGLPAPSRTEVFTNCLDLQHGMVFRLYEHERRNKHVPLHAGVADAPKYPKLLGEAVMKWSNKAGRGTLRYSVTVAVDETGKVTARMEERFREGGVGNVATIEIERSRLCTMVERRELDLAESKRAAAEAMEQAKAKNSKLLLAAPGTEAGESLVLAIPAPPQNSNAAELNNQDGGSGEPPPSLCTSKSSSDV